LHFLKSSKTRFNWVLAGTCLLSIVVDALVPLLSFAHTSIFIIYIPSFVSIKI
jgi:hypothetical protein